MVLFYLHIDYSVSDKAVSMLSARALDSKHGTALPIPNFILVFDPYNL